MNLDLNFEPADWQSVIGDLAPRDPYWSLFEVLGPHDALMLLKIRQLIEPYVTFGEPSPVDLFLLSIGESDTRSCTKVGGLPFWARDRPWPVSAANRPLPFLAQFNFQRSSDIVGPIPGDILLLFARTDFHGGIAIEWEQTARPKELITSADIPVTGAPMVWHGRRWRCVSYPYAEIHENRSIIELPDGKDVLSPYFTFRMLGMRIGDNPWQPSGYNTQINGERFLCSLCSIAPTVECPFPFLNHPEPLSQLSVNSFRLDLYNASDDDRVGLLNVIATNDGSFKAQIGYV